MFTITDIELCGGGELSNALPKAAEQISEWLEAGTPHTKPKSSHQLVDQATQSTYACLDGHIIGHANYGVGVDTQLSTGVHGDRGHSLSVLVPHYTIESFVVNPDLKGFGIGSMVLAGCVQNTLVVAKSKIEDEQHALTPHVVVLSALTSMYSEGIFLSMGFTHGDWVQEQLGYPKDLPHTKKPVYQIVDLSKQP